MAPSLSSPPRGTSERRRRLSSWRPRREGKRHRHRSSASQRVWRKRWAGGKGRRATTTAAAAFDLRSLRRWRPTSGQPCGNGSRCHRRSLGAAPLLVQASLERLCVATWDPCCAVSASCPSCCAVYAYLLAVTFISATTVEKRGLSSTRRPVVHTPRCCLPRRHGRSGARLLAL